MRKDIVNKFEAAKAQATALINEARDFWQHHVTEFPMVGGMPHSANIKAAQYVEDLGHYKFWIENEFYNTFQRSYAAKGCSNSPANSLCCKLIDMIQLLKNSPFYPVKL